MTDWNQYDEFLAEAERDDRVGEHDAIILNIEKGAWPNGEPRTRVLFGLTTAGNAKADCTLSVIPPPAELEVLKKSSDRARKRGVASNITMQRQLAELYGQPLDSLAVGQVFRVRTVKTKRDPVTGKGEFIRVVSFLPKEQVGKQVGSSSDVPF